MKECTDLEANFFIQIPASIWSDQTLVGNEKLIFGMITALSSNEQKICYASNSYFANIFGVDPKTISKWISNLKKKGLLKVRVNREKGSNEVISRFIRPTPPHFKMDTLPTLEWIPSPPKAEHINKNLITTNIGSEIPNLNEVEEFWAQESLVGNPKKFFYWRTSQGWKVKAGWKVSAIDWSDREKKIESNQRKRNLDSIEESFTDTEWAKSSIQH
tara:strand:- start:83 stop:730 length:648 start_codon:yes stop_codon:yes gene_type:complete